MTSLTTILGLLPLALGIGAGAELQAPLALTVMGGLTSSTFLTLIFVPALYLAIEGLFPAKQAVAARVETSVPKAPQWAQEFETITTGATTPPATPAPVPQAATPPPAPEPVVEPTRPPEPGPLASDAKFIEPPIRHHRDEGPTTLPIKPPWAEPEPEPPKPSEETSQPDADDVSVPAQPPATPQPQPVTPPAQQAPTHEVTQPPSPDAPQPIPAVPPWQEPVPPFVPQQLLNPRQVEFLEKLAIRKKITRKEYAILFNVSVPTAARDLKELVDRKLIQPQGPLGPGRWYELI
jgi:hypothetical protein